jgi:hypothetical protein
MKNAVAFFIKLAPFLKVGVDGAPFGKVMGQLSPLATCS